MYDRCHEQPWGEGLDGNSVGLTGGGGKKRKEIEALLMRPR